MSDIDDTAILRDCIRYLKNAAAQQRAASG
jgi:hypothetical protein